MGYYFGEWYESGLSALHVSEDEEIEESLFPPPHITWETYEGDSHDETESVSTKNIMINLVMKRVSSIGQLNIHLEM